VEKINFEDNVSNNLTTSELRVALSLLKPAVGNIEGQTDLLFLDDRAAAFNGELCVIANLGRKTGVEGAVRAGPLILAADRIGSGAIEIRALSGELRISAGPAEFGIAMGAMPKFATVIEEFSEIPKRDWSPAPPALLDAIHLCSFYTARALDRANMAGVALANGEALSTDGYRITWCAAIGSPEEKLFVPTRAAQLLPKYSIDSYCVRGGWLCLKGKELLFCARLLDYTFPDDKIKILVKEAKGLRGAKIPESLAEAVDRALVFLEYDLLLEKEMSLRVGGGKMRCEVERKDIGWFREDVPLEDKKIKFSISVNPEFMRKVLKHSTSIALVSDSALKLYSDSFEHLISLR
jgi:hypothetical protein